MKRIVFSYLLALSGGSAMGADLLRSNPPVIRAPTPLSSAPASSWSGFYLGVHGGGGMGDVTTSAVSELASQSLIASARKIDRSGPIGGVQAGFALQSGSLVYGLEGDLGFGALRGRIDVQAQDGSASGRLESTLSMLGTVRGRVGYAFDDLLLYGTGGFATGYHEAKATEVSTAGTARVARLTEWTPGWTLGLGGEYAVMPNVSLKLEYLYAQLNNRVLGQSVTHKLNLLRAGVNYRF